MREIKFRAWNPEKKSMDMVTCMFFKDDGNIDVEALPWKNKTIHDGMVLMQYACLKDKNGKEIYEGDIVTNGDRNKQVSYNSDLGRFEWYGQGMSQEFMGIYFEVIGNIYENLKLLEGDGK